MRILSIHRSFPGQFRHVLKAAQQQGTHQIQGLGLVEKPESVIPGVDYKPYAIQRGNTPGIHPLAVETESKVIRGEACAAAAFRLKQQGFNPDLIYGHPGFGEMLFLREIWPSAKLLSFQEFYYRTEHSDLDFDPELQRTPSWQHRAKAQMKNANSLLNLELSNWCVTPTEFQRSTYPELFHSRFSVIHDGIDTATAAPAQEPLSLILPTGQKLSSGEPIVTFVNRNIEPYRGCHSFIRAIPELQRLHPEATIVIVGQRQGVSYGAACPDPDGDWCDRFLAEIEGQYDPSRVIFCGSLPYPQFLQLLKLSAVHVYLTYPFVLSWSLLEAMSSGCAVVGSATAPVQEVIEHGRNGLLVDFFKPADIAAAIAELLSNRERARQLGDAARQTILERYSLERCIPQHLEMIEKVASGELNGRRG
jgi:glycosyltransferase involved in cell wall biosynthesis